MTQTLPVLILKVTSVLALGWFANRAMVLAMNRPPFAQKLSVSIRDLFTKILKFVLVVITALVVLDSFGISITPILASLGVSSIAVALALQDTLGNWFAGVYILVDKPFQVGDSIRLDSGVEGVVGEVGWRSTHLRTGANNIVVVPNSKIASALITNYSAVSSEIVFSVELTVPSDADLGRVERVCLRAAADALSKAPGAVSTHSPQALFQGFSDLGAKLEVSLRARSLGDVGAVRHEFVKTAQEQLKTDGISVAVRTS